MNYKNRTDLTYEIASKEAISEGVILEKSIINGLPLIKILIDEKGADALNKPIGEYITLFCDKNDEESETEALTEILRKLIPEKGKVLVAGLGNENITPDSLGVRTVSAVAATAHFSDENDFKELEMREIYVARTGVLAQTGMESTEQLKYLADGIKPDLIVAIDSLACSETDRLGRTIQITDTGIAPGSGVKNMRRELSKKTMGIPVIAIGVPTVIDLSGVLSEPNKTDFEGMVMPRNIDLTIKHFSKVISRALNIVLNPTLEIDEIEKLLF